MIDKSDLPETWSLTTIGQISENIQYGYTESAEDDPVGPKFLRISDIQDGDVDWDSTPYCEISEDEKEKYLLEEGDILFARTGGTVGKSFLIQGNIPEAVFASYLIRIQLSEHVDERYVYNFFKSNYYWRQVSDGKKGIGQANVNGSILSELELPLPPLEEQKRIVEKIEELLSKLDSGVVDLEKAKQRLELYQRAVLKSAIEGDLTNDWRQNNPHIESGQEVIKRLEEQYGTVEEDRKVPSEYELPEKWVWGSLGQIAELVSGQHIKSDNYNNEQNGTPYLTGPADFGEQSPTITKWTPEPKAMAYKDDVLITVKGAGVGKTNILENEKASISRQLKAIRPYEMNSKFLYYYIRSQFHYFQREGEGSTVPGLNRTQILSTAVPVLSMEEQDKVVEEIDRRLSVVSEILDTIEEELQRADRLRQSILKQAFRGELVPQEPVSGPTGDVPEPEDGNHGQDEQQTLSEVTNDAR